MTNYLIDSYTLFAASSLAANVSVRDHLPLFSDFLHTNLVRDLRKSRYAPSAPHAPAVGQREVAPRTEETEKVRETVDEAHEPK
ncbi:hypothetical protein JCM24511_06133 [Saitozyma sp. JCM 24511]|nr:hypothetical protein JCM24511_06133 [Saitozyma sp. JCM 24511]